MFAIEQIFPWKRPCEFEYLVIKQRTARFKADRQMHEHAGGQQTVGIGHQGAQLEGARAGIDAAVPDVPRTESILLIGEAYPALQAVVPTRVIGERHAAGKRWNSVRGLVVAALDLLLAPRVIKHPTKFDVFTDDEICSGLETSNRRSP